MQKMQMYVMALLYLMVQRYEKKINLFRKFGKKQKIQCRSEKMSAITDKMSQVQFWHTLRLGRNENV